MAIELSIKGMTCGHCQSSVTGALKGVAGVREVRVDLAAGKAFVEGDFEVQQLIDAVTEEGYEVKIKTGGQ